MPSSRAQIFAIAVVAFAGTTVPFTAIAQGGDADIVRQLSRLSDDPRGVAAVPNSVGSGAAVSTRPRREPTPPSIASNSMPRPSSSSAPSSVARGTTTAPAGTPAASITVNFRSGSADLLPNALTALDQLGRVLTASELANDRFRIEGHTDTVGAREANQTLSERRAAAVLEYLVAKFQIERSRLESVGRGEDDLLVPTNDEVPQERNRRVQVLNITGN